jgi:hypothetical protein
MKVPTEEVQNDSSPMRRFLALVPAMVSFEVSAQLKPHSTDGREHGPELSTS